MVLSRVLVLCSLVLARCSGSADICSMPMEVVSTSVSNQGKFAVWDEHLNALLWVDSPAFTPAWSGSVVYAYSPSTNKTHEIMRFEEAIVGSIMPLVGGGVLLAVSEKVVGSEMYTSTVRTMRVCPTTFKAGAMQTIATLPSDTMGKFNNGNCDAKGRYWVGSFDYGHEDQYKGTIWVMQPDANGQGYKVEVGIEHVGHGNGLFWRKDGAELLFSETYMNMVFRYDYSMADGAISKRSNLTTAPDTQLFDSMCGFDDGSFLVADPDSSVLRYFTADGQPKCNIKMNIVPSTFVASCAFGGGDLYIPTGRNGGDNSGPAGWLYRIKGVSGGVQSHACKAPLPTDSEELVVV